MLHGIGGVKTKDRLSYSGVCSWVPLCLYLKDSCASLGDYNDRSRSRQFRESGWEFHHAHLWEALRLWRTQPYYKWYGVYLLFQSTYPLSQVTACIPPISDNIPLSQVVNCIPPTSEHTPPITSGGMYTPYFRTHIPGAMYTPYFRTQTSGRMYTPYFRTHIIPLSKHIWPILRSVPLNLDCVPYSKTPNFDISIYLAWFCTKRLMCSAFHQQNLCRTPSWTSKAMIYMY